MKQLFWDNVWSNQYISYSVYTLCDNYLAALLRTIIMRKITKAPKSNMIGFAHERKTNILQCSQDSYKIWLNCLPTITGDFHSDVNFVLKMAFSANWLSRCIHIDNVVKHRKVFKYVCLQVFLADVFSNNWNRLS